MKHDVAHLNCVTRFLQFLQPYLSSDTACRFSGLL